MRSQILLLLTLSLCGPSIVAAQGANEASARRLLAQAQALVAKKQQRDYTEQAADLQEADATYLRLVRETYLDIAGWQPNWQVISLLEGDRLRSVDEVATQVQKFIEPMLRRG